MEQIEIKRYLLDKGILPNLKGFEFLSKAIYMCQADRRLLHELTKRLYIGIAEDFNETAIRVERAMRHAISSLKPHRTIGEFLAFALFEIDEIEYRLRRSKC